MKKKTFTKNRSVSASFAGLVLLLVGIFLAYTFVMSLSISRGAVNWADISIAFLAFFCLLVGLAALFTRSWRFIKAVANSIFNLSD